jgi:hypothetical protein
MSVLEPGNDAAPAQANPAELATAARPVVSTIPAPTPAPAPAPVLPVALVGTASRFGPHGAGGRGKTTLAAALKAREAIQEFRERTLGDGRVVVDLEIGA